jgi:CRP/FNR family transcriptional regulator
VQRTPAADEGLQRLSAISEHDTFETGDILVREGDPATNLFNITAGSVRVYKLLPDGRRQIVGFLFAGDFLGLATGDRYAFSAEALSTGSACRFHKKAYRKLLGSLPDLETALLDRASHELQAAHNQMLLLGRKTAVERLASFLMDLSHRDRRAGGEGRIILLPMTRAEIADYLGLTTETVSRVTSRLKVRGVIRLLTLHSLSIEKPAELATLAGLDASDASV